MKKNRDDFSRLTVDVLGKRVGFLCSNPDCRRHTIGPNDVPDKTTSIGIAAHITAAAPNGPRYNPNLSEEERIHIDNGIWLCSNCATLIDKDPQKFPVTLLEQWKADAENEMSEKLKGIRKRDAPFLEAELIWTSASRKNTGYSPKNKEVIVVGQDLPIIFWVVRWYFSLVIHNNSKFDAFNVKVESIVGVHFHELSKLNKVNNLPAYKNVDLEATYSQFIESTHVEADELMTQDVPKQLEGLTLKITYFDESREHELITIATIHNNELTNKRG